MSETGMVFPPDRTHMVRKAVLAFFDERRRDLPWRATDDPYRVWVSEIMLQQTRVETVVPYYERWLERFPTLDTLADAQLDDVLHLWQGLGYYTRARNLHRAARAVREHHGGRIPTTAAGLRTLPGIGVYTAGAIASIAFGRAEPAVDGNVRRVLCRILDQADMPPATLQSIAASLVPMRRPGDFNQALMELGSTVCTPRAPDCMICPLASSCEARANGSQLQRPRPRRAAEVPEYDIGTAVVTVAGRFLVARRPERGLLAGLWEFPGAAVRGRESPRSAARRAARTLGVRTSPRAGTLIAAIPHAFSHRRETYHAYLFQDVFQVEPTGDAIWASPVDLDGLALPVAQQRIARLAGATASPADRRGP